VSPLSRESAEVLEKGLTLCRRDEWDKGLRILGLLTESPERAALPGLYYSFLGYGIARIEGRVTEGLKLCQHSIKLEFYQPENYLNLARTHLMTKNRREAVEAIRRGLAIDPNNLELKALARELGVRRPPVIRFLSRDNPLNRLLGWLRHSFKKPD
jgi:tetratricopeptide (TPR) repeat protein